MHSACKCCTNADRKASNRLGRLSVRLAELRVHDSYELDPQESGRQNIIRRQTLSCFFLEDKTSDRGQVCRTGVFLASSCSPN